LTSVGAVAGAGLSAGVDRAAAATYDVDNYGASPDDSTDDTQAIRDAIADACGDTDATITFSDGTYNIQATDTGYYESGKIKYDHPILTIDGCDGLTIDGNGAKLSASGQVINGETHFAPTLHVYEADNVTLKNLTIDWDRSPPHTCGVVTGSVDDFFDVNVNDFYTARGSVWAHAFIEYDQNKDRLGSTLHLNDDEGCQALDSDTLRVYKTADNADAGLTDGDGVIIKHADAAGIGIHVFESDSFSTDDVKLREVPGMAVNIWGGSDANLKRTYVAPGNTAGRWRSAARDGFHISHQQGKTVLNAVTAQYTGDDAYNIKGHRYEVSTVVDSKTLEINKPVLDLWYEYAPFAAGDKIEIGGDKTGHPYNVDTVGTLADFQKTASERNVGTKNATYTLTFESSLPTEITDSSTITVFNATRTPTQTTLVNSGAKYNRGGARFKLDHTTVKNVTFKETTGNPAAIGVSKAEGEPANDLTVKDSTFDDCGYMPNIGGGQIFTFPRGYGDNLSPTTYSNWTIENNTFTNIRDGLPAVEVDHANDITVEGNDFSGINSNLVDPVVFGSDVDNTSCYSLSIRSTTSSGCKARWSQAVSVDTNTDYTLRGYIKTENVQTDGWGGFLAISQLGGPSVDATVEGTTDWTKSEITLNSEDYTTFTVRCGMGTGDTATGQVWFDRIELVDPNGNDLLTNGDLEDPTADVWSTLTLEGSPEFPYDDAESLEPHGPQ
jgi:hypothetical protein